MNKIIPLSVPSLNGNELKYVEECIKTEWVSTAGKYVGEFEDKIAEYTNSKYAIACVNGTSALQLALLMSDVQNGDEVIVPTLTFIAPINAVAYNNGIPIFMDCDDYYNIDIEKTIDFIKKQTVYKNGFTYNRFTNRKIKAIIPVHIWGNAVGLDELVNVCKERNITIVEDASESLGTKYTKGRFSGYHTGSIGKFGCISFNGNKIITSGGGGMIITSDKKLANKAKYFTTQAKDDPINYIHNEVGYNFRLTNIQAALGLAQLEQLPGFLEKKHNIFNIYSEKINEIDGLSVGTPPEYAINNCWLNIMAIDESKYGLGRIDIMNNLNKNKIQSRPIWQLNHLQKPYKTFQCYKIDNALKMRSNSLCLPSSVNIKDSEIERIVHVLKNGK